jgi:hypothetical protein
MNHGASRGAHAHLEEKFPPILRPQAIYQRERMLITPTAGLHPHTLWSIRVIDIGRIHPQVSATPRRTDRGSADGAETHARGSDRRIPCLIASFCDPLEALLAHGLSRGQSLPVVGFELAISRGAPAMPEPIPYHNDLWHLIAASVPQVLCGRVYICCGLCRLPPGQGLPQCRDGPTHGRGMDA